MSSQASSGSDGRYFSVYESVRIPPEQRTLGHLPGLVADALRLVWRAAPRELATLVVFQVIGGVGLGGQLLLGRKVIEAAIAAERRS
jgi:hypothetical protein